jgi:hypothetical protein
MSAIWGSAHSRHLLEGDPFQRPDYRGNLITWFTEFGENVLNIQMAR